MNDSAQCQLVGSSARFQAAIAQIGRIAAVDATVLIEGETGTGKELAARAIHNQGTRRDRPFVAVNCGALAESLLESELFGHERGAFTDAKLASPGLVSQADGGTLFLDEIDALSPKGQAALLRFLQDRSYRRVGSAQTRRADVRLLAASNANLEALVVGRQFRADLLYRINVLVLRMPPLRERGADVVELAERFLARCSAQYGMPAKRLHASFVRFLREHSWPGNVRELENVVQRTFLMSEGEELAGPAGEQGPSLAGASSPLPFRSAKAQAISAFEQGYVHQLMTQSDGSITRAAQLAGQDRSAFGKLVRKHLSDSQAVTL